MRYLSRTRIGGPLGVALLISALAVAPAFGQRTIIHAGHLIDGKSDQLWEGVTVVIEGNRIAGIKTGYANPGSGDKLVDLRDRYVMPGLMDMHTHVTGETEKGGYIKRFQQYPAEVALRSLKFLERTLMAGFTTVRNVGARDFVDFALRGAEKRGEIVSPRLYVSGGSLAVLGGHADGTNSYREDIFPVPDASNGVVNGVESARRAALLALKRGADHIKITATAGVLSLAANGSAPQFTEEEIRVIVETARDFGKKVCAHAHGAEGIKRAVRAGVASIEHGTYLDAEGMALMKKHGCYLVPTITAGKSVADSARIPGYYHDLVVPKAIEIGPVIQGTFAKAWKAGVPIAFGTDAGVFKHGKNAVEFEYMVEAGMPAMAAIQSATWHGAKLLGIEDQLGSIESGKLADLIAVDENPLNNISTLRRVSFVMKDGKVFKDRSSGEPSETE